MTETEMCLWKTPAEVLRYLTRGVAWIMTDILRTVVTSGGGRNAAIGTQPVGGKTGTTTDQYDIWFTGFTLSTPCQCGWVTISIWTFQTAHQRLPDSGLQLCAAYARAYLRVRSSPNLITYRWWAVNIIQSELTQGIKEKE